MLLYPYLDWCVCQALRCLDVGNWEVARRVGESLCCYNAVILKLWWHSFYLGWVEFNVVNYDTNRKNSMLTQLQRFTGRHAPILLLTALSLFSMTMLIARVFFGGYIIHAYLVWNLFLAWLPLLMATAAVANRHRPPLVIFWGLLWLLFLPNAPYLITDLMHLRPYAPVPVWYDALLLFSFALCGLLLALRSLSLMHSIATGRLGAWGGWLFVLSAAVLSSFGVYIGRFLRWNSWDVFANPGRLSADILAHLNSPFLLFKALVVVSLFSIVTLGAYLFWGARFPTTPVAPPEVDAR